MYAHTNTYFTINGCDSQQVHNTDEENPKLDAHTQRQEGIIYDNLGQQFLT